MLKEAFILYLVLRNPDPNKHYILDTDISAYAIGTILSQDFPDGDHLVAYFSKLLLLAKHNYCIIFMIRNYWQSFML